MARRHLWLLAIIATAAHAGKERRTPTCADAATVARCLARCELFNAESKMRGARRIDGVIANRCLEDCENDFCPGTYEPLAWVAPSAKKPVDYKQTTFRPVTTMGRGLVAVPRPAHKVFLGWRSKSTETRATYTIERDGKVIATTKANNFIDEPGQGTYSYRVNGCPPVRVTTDKVGRDYVELSPPDGRPGQKGSTPPISNSLLADTDGDGELEAVTWRKVGSDAKGDKRYVISIIEFDGSGVTRDFDTDMGRPPPKQFPGADWSAVGQVGKSILREPPGSESSLWTRPRAAGDVDGDGKEEIWTVGHHDGKCVYMLLRDDGVKVSLVAHTPSPYPICDGEDNSRHDAFIANLDGSPNKLSLGMAGGRHEPWRIFTWDLVGNELRPRWDSGSGVATKRNNKVHYANQQNSHNVAVVDLDCDGRDEIIAGGTVVDDDGSILWGTTDWFGYSAHIDGAVIDDIDPSSPGFEVLLFSETGPEWGLYRAADGSPLIEAVTPEFHLQWNLAVNVTGGPGLDVVGTFGGHLVEGGFTYSPTKGFSPYPFGRWPREALNWYPIDWDGIYGHQAVIYNYHVDGSHVIKELSGDNPRVYGVHGEELAEINGGINDSVIKRELISAVDLLGDHREEVLVQMSDGSLRAYLNVEPLSTTKPTKLEDPHYRKFLAHASFPSHVAALGLQCDNLRPRTSKKVVRDWEGGGTDVKKLREKRPRLVKAANDKKSTVKRRDVARAGLRSLDQEIKIAELRVQVRRMVNLCESPGCWRRADKDKTRRGETQAQKYARKDPHAVDPTKGRDPLPSERRQPVRDGRCDRRVGPDRAKTGSKGTVRASIGGRCFQNRHSAVGRQLWLLDRYAEAHPGASSDLELVQSLWIQEVPKK